MRSSLLIALLLVASATFASPQIYPSGILYMGTGKLSVRVSVYNPDIATVDAELVLVKDLRQNPKDDILISSMELRKNQNTTIPVTFDIKNSSKTFYLCVRSYEKTQAIRDCSVIQQRKI